MIETNTVYRKETNNKEFKTLFCFKDENSVKTLYDFAKTEGFDGDYNIFKTRLILPQNTPDLVFIEINI